MDPPSSHGRCLATLCLLVVLAKNKVSMHEAED